MSARDIFISLAFLAAVVLAAIINAAVWEECRAHGHSILYCIAVTGR